MKRKSIFCLGVSTLFLIGGITARAQESPHKRAFSLKFGPAGITSLKNSADSFDTGYVAPGASLGDVSVSYRIGGKRWRQAATQSMTYDGRRRTTDPRDHPARYEVAYNFSQRFDWGDDLELTEAFQVEGDGLIWTLRFRNLTDESIEIGDIALPLPFNTRKGWDRVETETLRVMSHSFISGHGSFVFWMRPNSIGPYFVMVPMAQASPSEPSSSFAPTKLEFSGSGQGFQRAGQGVVYIHSAVIGAQMKQRGGTWRQPNTSVTLAPMLTPGSEVTYGFKFRWAEEYEGVRDVLFEEGLFDVNIVPGMTVPEDLEAMMSLRTKNAIQSITPEFPDLTKIEFLGKKSGGENIYRVKFSRRGENLLTVNYGRHQTMALEFFVTEPLETLIRKRAEFLATRQLIRDPNKWYDGILAEWDMKNKRLLTPETPGYEENYNLTMGDPMLSRAPFLAAKNSHFPSQKEIEAADYHIKNFVWGKLQLTDKEAPLPYGIFSIPNWKVNRESMAAPRPGSWKGEISRAYDYPHYTVLYFSMSKAAKNFPELKTALSASEYLTRAFGTARAYFNLPFQRNPPEHNYWYNRPTAQTTGMYNEIVIPELVDELYAGGRMAEAEQLRREWEKKVRYFVKEDPYLWGSEFAFDPTGFESTHALSKYAIEHAFLPGSRLDLSWEEIMAFMEKEIQANIAARGWLEPAYYVLGAEGALRYMSQMGGWSILDYALYYSHDPMKYLRLGYASYLSSWALMNTGTPESDYGYWFPGPENDGGTGSAFVTQPFGTIWWDGRQYGRGAWPFGAEIDLGYCGALRTAATVVADDPLFGLFAYGGQLTRTAQGIEVVPKDGLRERFHVIRGQQRFHMALERDGFAKDRPIFLADSLNEIRFILENRGGGKHASPLGISGAPAGTYQVSIDGVSIGTVVVENEKESAIMLPAGDKASAAVVIKRTKS